MALNILVPQIGEAITDSKLVEWLKHEGESVSKGDVLFLLDTDKAIVEVEAPADGVLAKILIPEGSTVTPREVAGLLETQSEEEYSDIGSGRSIDEDEIPVEEIHTADNQKQSFDTLEQGSLKAKRLANELGLDLKEIHGTGEGGVITIDDVLQAAQAGSEKEIALTPLSKRRQSIARQMILSKQTVPHFYLMMDVDMSQVAQLRTECVESLGWRDPPTYTDIIIRACALALAETPSVNVIYSEEGIISRDTIDIGIVVGLEDGVIVPVLSNADQYDLQETSIHIHELTARARQERLREGDLCEKSMVVSNLGMFGVDAFIAIIDIPDPMILAVGRVADRIVPVDGQPAVRPYCSLTLSIDHRVFYGIQSAAFLGKVKTNLEQARRRLL